MNISGAALWQQAQQAIADNQPAAAQAALRSLLQQSPAHVGAHLLLGAIAFTQGQLRDSARHTVDASLQPAADVETLCHVVTTLLRVGEVAHARRYLDDQLVATCNDGPLLARLASLEQMIGRHPTALALLDRSAACGLDNPDVRYLRAVQLTFNGRRDEAEIELEKSLRDGTGHGRASVTLARLRRQTAEHNHVDAIRARLKSVRPAGEDHAALEFALYKELEDLGDNAGAGEALQRGNAIMHASLRHDAADESRRVQALIQRTQHIMAAPDVVERNFLERDASEAKQAAGPQPIFIVGMPRSGTTLLDRMLGNHSQVVSAGELGDFGRQLRWVVDRPSSVPLDDAMLTRLAALDYRLLGRRYLEQTRWRAPGTRFFVDKLPANYLLTGMIARALPDARILHMVRDPMDTCFSNYRAFFGGGYAYSYDLASLASHYRDYRTLMDHWHRQVPGRIHDVHYQALTLDAETTMAEVFAFCGLAQEPGCTDLGRNRDAVATLSAVQVRDGVTSANSGQWRRHETRLAPLLGAINDLA